MVSKYLIKLNLNNNDRINKLDYLFYYFEMLSIMYFELNKKFSIYFKQLNYS